MSGEVRVLDTDATFRRIAALDALALNADRRYREWSALDPAASLPVWQAAYGAWLRAKREYEAVRDTPYRLAGEETR